MLVSIISQWIRRLEIRWEWESKSWRIINKFWLRRLTNYSEKWRYSLLRETGSEKTPKTSSLWSKTSTSRNSTSASVWSPCSRNWRTSFAKRQNCTRDNWKTWCVWSAKTNFWYRRRPRWKPGSKKWFKERANSTAGSSSVSVAGKTTRRRTTLCGVVGFTPVCGEGICTGAVERRTRRRMAVGWASTRVRKTIRMMRVEAVVKMTTAPTLSVSAARRSVTVSTTARATQT